ncbi:hypothetical protein Tco_0607609 [Tanacetum coccineum]
MTGNKSLFSTYKAYDRESLNVTFDESPPPTKLSPLVDDDVGEEEAIRKHTKIGSYKWYQRLGGNSEKEELLLNQKYYKSKRRHIKILLPPTITAMKIPIIKKGEYDIWSMRMRQYICHTDHNLWDIIVNNVEYSEDEATPSGEQS